MLSLRFDNKETSKTQALDNAVHAGYSFFSPSFILSLFYEPEVHLNHY